jgi:pyruvate dehydrogenase E2 component (dihydrolipoamide acetyltransferase)
MSLFERHLDLMPAARVSAWRKLAIGTWRMAKDPSVYGALELDVTRALAFLERLNRESGVRVTLTHFMGRAVAEAFRREPHINALLRFGRVYPRKHVSLFFQVATDAAGADLSGVTVLAAETKSTVDLAREIGARVGKVRDGSDRSFSRMKGMMGLLPGFLAGLVLDFAGFVQFALNIWTPLFGTPKDPLGSVMITNTGSLGLQFALAPLVMYSRTPMVLTVGAVADRVIAVDGMPVVRKALIMGVTFDHRIIDGVHAAKLAQIVQKVFADPEGELRE